MKRSRFSEEQTIGIFREAGGAQKSGEAICKTTGCEDECASGHWKSGGGLSSAGTLEIELLPQRPIEPGGPGAPGKEVLELSGKHLPTVIGVLRR